MNHSNINLARQAEILAAIASRPDGIERAELVARWGISAKCAAKPFNALKRAGLIDLTTPKGGKPRWTTVDRIDALRAKIAAERETQARLSKKARNARREAKALEETGYRRAHTADGPDMPVVQRVVDRWDPAQRPANAVASVWEWKGQTLRRRPTAEVAP